LRIIITAAIVIINFILHTTVLQHISIMGVKPDITTAVVISLSIMLGKEGGTAVGLASGLLQDIMFSKPVGVTVFYYSIMGYIAGVYSEKIFRDNMIVPVVFTAGATVFKYAVIVFFGYVLNTGIPLLYCLRYLALPEILYNSILSLPVYRFLHIVYLKRFSEEGFRIKKSK
jgi:rod shape-determining protein MreD